MAGASWKPGQSGNPAGRAKKGLTFTDVLKKELEHKIVVPDGDEEKIISQKAAVCQKLINLALAGDVSALKYLMDRIDGKPDVFEHVIQGNLDLTNIPPAERKNRIAQLLAKRSDDDEA